LQYHTATSREAAQLKHCTHGGIVTNALQRWYESKYRKESQ
jgi:hypothetical protein